MAVAPSGTEARRVLVVDDESYLRSFIKDVLEPGFEVAEAADGLVALKLLESSVAVIIVDYMMPEMSGVELIKRLRATRLHRTTPVLVLTGHDEDHLLRECTTAGATRILTKPFHPTKLIAAVRELSRDG